MEKLIDYYKQILTSMGLTVEEDGTVTHQLTGDVAPLKVKGQPLVLPSRELLSRPLPNDRVIFHPLSENVVRGGESEVLKTMRDVVELQTTFYLIGVMRHLAHFATGNGPKLNGRQTSSLKPLQEADDKFLKFLDNVIDASDVKGQNRIVKFFMARSLSLNGRKHTRACVVKFPVLSQAADERKDKVFGVKFPRKKDRTLLVNLMQIILDDYGLDEEYYSCGSSSTTAPYWDALLGSYLKVATRINDVLKSFGKHIPDVQFVPPMHSKLIDTSEWENEIVSMHRLRDTIPPMPLNTGVAHDSAMDEAPVEGVTETAPVTHAPTPAPAQASVAHAPTLDDTPPWETPQHSQPATQVTHAPDVTATAPAYSYGYGSPAAPTQAGQGATALDPYSLETLMATEQQIRSAPQSHFAAMGQYGGGYGNAYRGWGR